ncbi:RES family NAD+ phosphorylase [Sphingomonas endophytica]|uniref:RES domain-containing protein n=1 Tax=Sphingomonas endophytica TaxID=869719 RepID=A0A147I9A3_9SPHN|nr:RES family NAD+ phosphorylase [Sphingomonas endophytica]KTT75920.1 RES domain-containing protein [Sphingomonas endophytica]
MLRLRPVRAGTVFHRIHRHALSPLFFGPAGATPIQRYDDPAGGYKLLYLALDLETAFGETLVRVPTVTDILSSDVAQRVRSELVATRGLRLYPLVDAGVSAHGLSFTELHGADYRRTQAIGAEIHVRTGADGILYTSRFNDRRCVALFDRARDAVRVGAVEGAALTPELAHAMAARFGKFYVDP